MCKFMWQDDSHEGTCVMSITVCLVDLTDPAPMQILPANRPRTIEPRIGDSLTKQNRAKYLRDKNDRFSQGIGISMENQLDPRKENRPFDTL